MHPHPHPVQSGLLTQQIQKLPRFSRPGSGWTLLPQGPVDTAGHTTGLDFKGREQPPLLYEGMDPGRRQEELVVVIFTVSHNCLCTCLRPTVESL